ncbi:hypothetical protein ACOSQ4_013602 [Xanthoceras sorbifolium]
MNGLVFLGSVLVEIAEVRVILEGLRLAAELNVFPSVVESDALSVVNLYVGVFVTRSDVDNLIFNIQVLLNSLRVISIGFVSRACNVVAHSVARRTLSSCSLFFWVNSFPSWMITLALDNVTDFVSV